LVAPLGVYVPGVRKVQTIAGTELRKEGGEADHEPLRQIERLKKNFPREFVRISEWLEDLDLTFAAFHGPDCDWLASTRSSLASGCAELAASEPGGDPKKFKKV
jgi:hypothetical protein